ncbi:glycoside hydrolase family 28 protein [Chitinophaga barathri]|nr:glycosyl hydrolase family 28 protein [Chitinophaga barathri]
MRPMINECKRFLHVLFYAGLLVLITCLQAGAQSGLRITLKPDVTSLSTQMIQQAIDSCAGAGGGTVVLAPGEYLCGSITLKSKVRLQLDKGALLKGSDKYADYRNDAFIYGKGLSDVAITGGGTIDGVDCYNPKGEEGFRGPHCIRLIDCQQIVIDGITIKNSANWAINCRNCSGGKVTGVTILGGHDGLHTRFCSSFTVSGCDFRTGDDAFAGNDNRDFVITDCKVNTSCNGFRIGCLGLRVERCKIWGPGEYMHKIQRRTNMLSAFVHFSPKDEHPVLKSGNWVVRDVEIENVDHLYNYNFQEGLWQTGQPVTSIRFENIRAKGLLSAFNIIGDLDQSLVLEISGSQFRFRERAGSAPGSFEGAKLSSTGFFNARNFSKISLTNITLERLDHQPLLQMSEGKEVILNNVRFVTGRDNSAPYRLTGISGVTKSGLQLNGEKMQ